MAKEKKAKPFEKALIPEGFTVTYHAGALNTPANTLESVKVALEAHADILEVDVSFLPDGTAVLIHDSTPVDTTLPTLESALQLISQYPYTKVNLDLKSIAGIDSLDRLINKYHMLERVFFTGVTEDWAPIVRFGSAIPYYLNETIPPLQKGDKAYAEGLSLKIRALGAIGLNAWYGNADKYIVKRLHQDGLLVSLWTVNTEEDMRLVLLRYPDNITTLHPDILNAVLAE